MSDSENPDHPTPPVPGETRQAWRTPTLRVIAASATESGAPDDYTERAWYETKKS